MKHLFCASTLMIFVVMANAEPLERFNPHESLKSPESLESPESMESPESLEPKKSSESLKYGSELHSVPVASLDAGGSGVLGRDDKGVWKLRWNDGSPAELFRSKGDDFFVGAKDERTIAMFSEDGKVYRLLVSGEAFGFDFEEEEDDGLDEEE
ncbi:MAG: hypothetical protein ACPG5T_09840 [Endozoicomonas sp.]